MIFALLACDGPTPTDPPVSTPDPTCQLAAPAGTCGTGRALDALIPGPADADYDPILSARAPLAEAATAFSRLATGASLEVRVLDPAVVKQRIETGDPLTEAHAQAWTKAAGAYAGVAIAADAYRYGTLRDQGADCSEVNAARDVLLDSLDVLHKVQAITGTPGVLARSLARKGWAGSGMAITVPLFDEQGAPLPETKNNGTWRKDVSDEFPELVWEDSISRDQYIGWIVGIAAAWEVIHADPDVPEADKTRLQDDALVLLQALMVVQESGYDLELQDADGRPTFHANMHHESIDTFYVPGARNSLYALMGLGIAAALVAVTNDDAGRSWLDEDLIATRGLPVISQRLSAQLPLGTVTNFSNLNMAYIAGWLATRYLCNEPARDEVVAALALLHTEGDGALTPPAGQEQALYDLPLAVGDRSAYASGPMLQNERQATINSLADMRDVPMFDTELVNCDANEIQAGVCELVDGSMVDLLGYVGRNNTLISATPVPMQARPPSNYHWRSHPYQVNAGVDGLTMYPMSDWRFVYWAGRYVR